MGDGTGGNDSSAHVWSELGRQALDGVLSGAKTADENKTELHKAPSAPCPWAGAGLGPAWGRARAGLCIYKNVPIFFGHICQLTWISMICTDLKPT